QPETVSAVTRPSRTSSLHAGRADRRAANEGGGGRTAAAIFVASGADLAGCASLFEGIDIELVLRLLDVSQPTPFARAHAFLGGDLQQSGVEFPLLEDGGLLLRAEVGAGNNLCWRLEHAAGIGEGLFLVFADQHVGLLSGLNPENGRPRARVPIASS